MERYEPLTIPRDRDDPVPICPSCRGLLKRRVDGPWPSFGERLQVTWSCPQHGDVAPVWAHWIEQEEVEDE